MHCHTTASSELVLCPCCGRELREAPPKLMTLGAPTLLALLLVTLLVTQWNRISPIAWARANLVRGVVLVEDISARIEPEMVIVMTPIVPDASTSYAVGDASPSIAGDPQAVALAPNPDAEAGSTEPEAVLAASVIQELPFGVGGPEPEDQAQAAVAAQDSVASAQAVSEPAVPESASIASEPAESTEVVPEAQAAAIEPPPPTATALPPTPTATATPEPTVELPTPTTLPTTGPTAVPTEATAVQAAGLAASLAKDGAASTPTPTWTAVADDEVSGEEEQGSVQVAALTASETSLPTPTATPTVVTTPLPTPTATPIVYQVRSGDTLVTIASSYEVDVDALMAANNISEQDVYSIQPGQMLIVPTPEPALAAVGTVTNVRVDAPQLVVPTNDARIGCATGGTLIWQRVQFVKDSDKYVLHLGFVSGRASNGQEQITWVLAHSSPVTVTEWQLDSSLCDLAPDEFDAQWRWWVEVVETVDGETVSVSPPSEVRGFTWQ